MKGSRTAAVVLGVVAGSVLGWVLAGRQLERHREDLFSSRPLRRFAALSGLSADARVETVSLLRDYLGWERHPLLRRRAGAIVRRMESRLG